MKTVILINGNARSGKDTCAKLFKKELREKCKILSFAKPIKNIIANTFDISLEELEDFKNHTYSNRLKMGDYYEINFRQILQRFGTEGMKEVFGENVWVKLLIKKIKKSNKDYFIVPDFRFQEEAEEMLQLANKTDTNVYFIQVNSDMELIPDKSHQSENDLKDFIFDYKIYNKFGELSIMEQEVKDIVSKID